MREVIAEIRRLESKIDMFDKKFEDKFQMTHDKIQMVHDKLSNEIKTIYWVNGIVMTIMLFLISRK